MHHVQLCYSACCTHVDACQSSFSWTVRTCKLTFEKGQCAVDSIRDKLVSCTCLHKSNSEYNQLLETSSFHTTVPVSKHHATSSASDVLESQNWQTSQIHHNAEHLIGAQATNMTGNSARCMHALRQVPLHAHLEAKASNVVLVHCQHKEDQAACQQPS